MATKQTPKRTKAEETKKRKAPKSPEKYFLGVGRRKSAVARVRLTSLKTENETAENIEINKKPFKKYFTVAELREAVLKPIEAAGLGKKVKVSAVAAGGGIRGQAEAILLGIARAIVAMNGEHKKTLRAGGYLTRDDRKVERKKAGLKKARRAPQWQKR